MIDLLRQSALARAGIIAVAAKIHAPPLPRNFNNKTITAIYRRAQNVQYVYTAHSTSFPQDKARGSIYLELDLERELYSLLLDFLATRYTPCRCCYIATFLRRQPPVYSHDRQRRYTRRDAREKENLGGQVLRLLLLLHRCVCETRH